MAIRPDPPPLPPPPRAMIEVRAKLLARPAEAQQPGGAVARPLPPASEPVIADDRFQPTRAIVVGMRESRALATLAADIVDRLSEAAGVEADRLRTRLREVVEIGSARDTGGPLAGLYAAARRDPASPLARVLANDRADPAGFKAALAAAAQELRALDERFAARDFALSGSPSMGPSLPKPLQPPTLDVMV
ncbi:MAG: hypothetical protein MUC89_07345 [Acetobacteraceae bacterium]|nr:hypothetical protein [Acetobacteraceae bacterium]